MEAGLFTYIKIDLIFRDSIFAKAMKISIETDLDGVACGKNTFENSF
jgi:hypothetical protein